MKKDYKDLIWTNHALERMQNRGIKQGDAWATFRNPDSSKKAKAKGAFIYYKTFGNTKIEVVAKKDPSANSGKGQWVIVSVWSKRVKGKKLGLNVLSKIKKFWKS